MKIISKDVLCFIIGYHALIECAFAQGAFQNLNFESAIVVPIAGDPYNRVQFAPAFPGWTGTINGNPQTTTLYNNYFLGSSGVTLLGPGANFHLEGSFTPVLQASSLAGSSPTEVAFSQNGQIPNASLSLQFLATDSALSPNANLTVSINGVPLNLLVLESFANYNLYGASVSSFAGQTVELRIANRVNPRQFGQVYFDALSFSPNAIPEPGTWALLGLGSAFLWCAARRPKK